MDIEGKNNHYVHTVEHPHSQRSISKSFHTFEQGNHIQQIAVANHNTIQVYRNVGSSIVYDTTHYFMCDISVMEVVPVKGESSDVLFLADELGRFMFWSPTLGTVSANNTIRSPQYLAPFYQKAPAEEKQPQFSGLSYSFNSLDTEAVLFFTAATKIIVLRIRWSKDKIFYIHPPVEITCPYLDINFIGIVGGKDPFIGIVQQRQQKTFLRLHRANSQNFECAFTLEKGNLSSFYSTPQGEDIITITNSQLSIYNIKLQQTFCTFQIAESGFVCSLDHEKYLYVGELGSQMIVFSKKHYKNYGSFMMENEVCMRLASHGRLSDGGFLVSVIDQGHTVEFIALFEESWRSVRSIFSTISIYSVQDLQRPNECLAVVRVGQNIHQVGVLSKKQAAKLQKQKLVKTPILALFSANNGKAVILSCHDSNSVLIYDEDEQIFELGFQFQPGVIIKVSDKYVIMQNKIYQMDLNANAIKELWNEKAGIVAVDFDGKFIGFQCSDFCFKFYNTDTKEIDRIRKNCFDEYIWRFHCRQTLVVGALDLPGKIKIVPVFKQASIVATQCNEIISDIASFGEIVIISFSNCKVHLYDFSSMNTIQIIECSSQPLQLLNCGQKILAYGVNQSYIIKINQQSPRVVFQQVQFDPSKQNIEISYLHTYDKFVVSHQQSLAMYSLSVDRPEHASSFRVVSMNMGVNNDTNPPFATVHDKVVYVAYCYEIIMRNMNTVEVLKKQSHGLKQICCIQKIDLGLLVCGIDDMENAQIFLFSYKDLQILLAESLSKKSITAMRRKQGNSFFLREENIVSLYQVKEQMSLKQVFATKTGLNGYTLSVQPTLSMLMASDPLRYLVVYDYRLGKLVSLCRYQNLNTINDAQFLQCAAVIGDAVGNITVAQFNFDKGEVLRTTMSDVGSLKTGSEIIQITKSKQGVIYSTISGSVGRLRAIGADKFAILKQVEKQALFCLQSKKNELKYQEWVNRTSLSDKLIDGFLIDSYLSTSRPRDSKFQKVEELWRAITHKLH